MVKRQCILFMDVRKKKEKDLDGKSGTPAFLLALITSVGNDNYGSSGTHTKDNTRGRV